MAGFGDSNDIKISVTLDTKDAVAGVKQLTDEINLFLKRVDEPFKKLGELSKQAAKVQIADIKAKAAIEIETIKATDAEGQRKHERIIERIRQETNLEKVASAEFIRLEKMRVDEAIRLQGQRQAANKQLLDASTKENIARIDQETKLQQSAITQTTKQFAEAEKTKRAEIKQTIAETQRETAAIRKSGGGGGGGAADVFSSGKLIEGFQKSLTGISLQFGNANVGFATFINNFKNLGAAGLGVAGLVAVGGILVKFNDKLTELADQAGKLEGLKTGFETLQRGIGENPVKSIEKLRQATQGLISDTDLYQRANQAVLLGVPTKVFNEAAAAAVKLGRAMGIDASFGLESLSLGLGRQSRLYLDNLGIVVSAEEAYQKFAIANNIVGRSLTDSEKRAAFYAEALQKIKERAQELPEILDSVGIASQKVGVAQQNVNAAYLNGFNSSFELAEAYKEQAAITQSSAGTSELFGRQVAKLGSGVVDTANTVKIMTNALKEMGVAALDVFVRASPEKQIEDLNKKIELAQGIIRKNAEEIRDFGGTLGDSYNQIRTQIIQKYAEEIKIAQQKLQELKYTVQEVRDEAGNPIKVKVDLTEVSQAQSTFKTLIADLRAGILEQGGQFEVPGISPEALEKAGTAVEELTLKVLKSKGNVAGFDEEFKKIQDQLAFDIQSEKAAELGVILQDLRKKQAQFGDTSSDAYKENIKAIGQAEAELAAYNREAGISVQAEKAAKKALEARIQSAKRGYQELLAEQKRNATNRSNEIKQQQQRLRDLTRSLGRSLDQAIPPNVQQELLDVFNDPQLNAEQLRAKIQKIGEAFLKAGGDYQAFAKEVSQLNELKNKFPDRPLIGSSDQTNAADEYNKQLASIQKNTLNLRDMLYGEEIDPATGRKAGGGFFGFDIESLDGESEAAVAGAFQSFLGDAFQAGVDGFSREDVPGIVASLGGAVGAAIGAYIGGPAGAQIGQQIGSVFGQILGEQLAEVGKDLKGTEERKQIDKYLAEVFDGDRLAVVIGGQIHTAVTNGVATIGSELTEVKPQLQRISDLVFEGFTPFSGMVRFGGENFANYFNTLSAEVQNSFTGVGLALGTLQGVGAETALLIGNAIANNIGGSLQNLQVLVQQTGETFEDLSQAVLKAFRDAQLTAEQAYNSLVQLQNIYAEGIPGAIGDFKQAIENLNISLQDERPGQYALDSLRDIGAEGEEARASFQTVVATLGQTFGFAADQQARLFEALRLSGITSLQQLAKASDEQLITLIRNINAIRQNAEAPLATVPVVPTTTPRVGGGGRSKRDEAAELLKKQKEEARKLTQESQKYLEIIDKINNGQISAINAGKQIAQINAGILKSIKRRDEVEKALNAELDKGSKGDKKRIGELSKEYEELQKKLKAITEEVKKGEREYKQLNIASIIPLIKSQNSLGLIAEQVGVSLQKNVDILVKGFLQGRLSISEVNEEIKKTKDLLGPGIPGAVGAVTEAFQNLIDAGTKGGQFSLDAFTDVFAEFREKFNKEGSSFREAQRRQLVQNLDIARQASLTAVGPEASEAARKALELAKKALEDFKNVPLVPDLSDLRQQLKNSFSPEQVELFFQAIDESGLKSFEDLEKAGAESIISILGRLTELGFKFNQTSEEASDINRGLRGAERAANAGLDPLQKAIELVKQFNDGAEGLPPVFNSTTQAIGELNGPLSQLAAGFDNIIEKLGLLSGNTFENDVVFNIRTTGEEGGKALVELIFGDGSQVSTPTGNGTTTPSQTTPPAATPPKGGGNMGSRNDWVRVSPGRYRNKKTGKIITSKTNPGA